MTERKNKSEDSEKKIIAPDGQGFADTREHVESTLRPDQMYLIQELTTQSPEDFFRHYNEFKGLPLEYQKDLIMNVVRARPDYVCDRMHLFIDEPYAEDVIMQIAKLAPDAVINKFSLFKDKPYVEDVMHLISETSPVFILDHIDMFKDLDWSDDVVEKAAMNAVVMVPDYFLEQFSYLADKLADLPNGIALVREAALQPNADSIYYFHLTERQDLEDYLNEGINPEKLRAIFNIKKAQIPFEILHQFVIVETLAYKKIQEVIPNKLKEWGLPESLELAEDHLTEVQLDELIGLRADKEDEMLNRIRSIASSQLIKAYLNKLQHSGQVEIGWLAV